MGRGGVNEGGGEVLSHLISLDTRHPASLKQPLSLCQSRSPVEDAAHACAGRTLYAYTQIQNKGNPKTNISATWRRDRRVAAENGNNWDEDKGKRREVGRGSKRKVEYVSAESWWSILLPAGYSCKY